MRLRLLMGLTIIFIAGDCFAAAKKDLKGLFGSYRREKFTENEGNDTDFGVDLMLATAFPMGTLSLADSASLSASDQNNLAIGSAMPTSAFFSGEVGVWMTLKYHFRIFANIGYYGYDTRLGFACTATSTCYSQFNMTLVPIIAGVKYRFGRSDIVPYVGAGAGMTSVTSIGNYDFTNAVSNTNNSWALTLQATLGVEFFISPHVGLRMEASGMYLNLPGQVFPIGAALPSATPIIKVEANPLLVRYSSGLFVIF